MPNIFSMFRKAGLKRYYALMKIPTYNITSSRRWGYTWFQVPKNGTRTVLNVLRTCTEPDADEHYLPYYPSRHLEHFKFSFMRNPWDRLVSCYKDKVWGELLFPECWGKDFNYFVDFVSRQDLRRCDPHFRIQASLFPLKDMDHIARFEDFPKEFDYIINQKLQLNSELPHINKTKYEQPYTEFYDDRKRKIVAELYKEDIALMSYAFGQ